MSKLISPPTGLKFALLSAMAPSGSREAVAHRTLRPCPVYQSK